MTIEIGRVVVKIAGRDAGKKGVIIDVLDNNCVLVDGETRRRKCNVLHIEPLAQTVKIGKNASHEDVTKILKDIGIETRQTKPKPKTQKPKKKRKTPAQLREQKQEKRKFGDIFKPKKKEEKVEEKKEGTLEEKAGLVEEKKEEKYEHKEHHKETEHHKTEKKETKKKQK